MSAIQLVVARYQEPLNWLRKVPPSIERVVYDKSGEPTPDAIPLPNIGREAHTYLHHICENYRALAPLTVFCQGKPFDHAFDFHHTLRALAENPEGAADFRWLGHIIDTDTSDGALFKIWSKNESGVGLDLAGFYCALLGMDGPHEYPFVLGGQFWARRELIWKRPLSFYESARDLSVAFPNAAHCYERTWDKVFGVEGIAPELLAGRKTVYLKTVKKESTHFAQDNERSN